MQQAFIRRNPKLTDDLAFERKLYVIRKRAERAIRYGTVRGGHSFYISSLSARTLVYKGMLLTEQMDEFYPDLTNPAMESALALVHSRFSTNTFPELGPGASLPLHRAQRGDQHPARQHQLDARPPGDVPKRLVRQRPAQAAAGHQPGRQRFGDV